MTDCEGQADGPDRLRMVQRLSFQGAAAQERTWILWRTGPHEFKATANDMVGTAIGQADGRSFHWKWVLANSPAQRPFDVTLEQWMYQLNDGSLLIRTTISKLGIILTEISEHFTRVNAEAIAARYGCMGQVARHREGTQDQPCMKLFNSGVGIVAVR